MSATKLYPAAPLESGRVIEERLKKKLNDIINFNNSIKNLKEMVTYSETKIVNQKREKKIMKFHRVYLLINTFVFFCCNIKFFR